MNFVNEGERKEVFLMEKLTKRTCPFPKDWWKGQKKKHVWWYSWFKENKINKSKVQNENNIIKIIFEKEQLDDFDETLHQSAEKRN